MKILVTGNTGYVGSVLCQSLINRGHSVIGYDTDYYKNCNFLGTPPEVKQINKDIRDVELEDVKGCDAILHLAALSNDPVGEIDPQLTYAINYKSTIKLAKLAKKAEIKRFVYASSCSLYGIAGDKPLAEDSPMAPVTAYAKSKVKSEEALSKLAGPSFVPVYLRPSTVYGVSPRLRCDIVLNNLVGWAFTTGKIRILSDGTPWRPSVHVEDLADAFILATEAPEDLVNNEAFNVGQNKENYQIRDMAAAVKRVVPDCEVEYTHQHGSDSRTYIVNFDKISNVLKFSPKWDIEKGARQLYEAFKVHGLTEEEFTGNKFIRLNQLKTLLKEEKIDNQLFWRENE